MAESLSETSDDMTQGGESENTFNSDDNYGTIDRPRTPGTYQSETMKDTVLEIQAEKMVNTRPLIKMKFIRPRKHFGQGCKLNEKEASEQGKEIRQANDPSFEYHESKKIIDIGWQVGGKKSIRRTQTRRNRVIDRVLETVHEDMTVQINEQEPKFLKFLENGFKFMEQALQKNETISIFKNDLNCQVSNDMGANDVELSTQVKNINTFLQKKGKVSCIQFFPLLEPTKPQVPPLPADQIITERQAQKSTYILANSVYRHYNNNLDQQLKYQLRSTSSFIQIWDWEDRHSMEPIMILVSPLNITCFDFNPIDYNMVVAGASNGQVILWDLKGKLLVDDQEKKKRKKQRLSDKSDITTLEPILMTELPDPKMYGLTGHKKQTYTCHRGPIVDLKWLPEDLKIDKKSLFRPPFKAEQGISGQFFTLSANGELFIWKTQFEEDKDPRKQDLYKFTAMYGFQLFKPHSNISLGGAQIAFQPTSYSNSVGKSSTVYVTTSDGDLLMIDWTQRPTETSQLGDKVQTVWDEERCFRPAVGLDINPFFPNIVLTVHDYHFSVWDVENEVQKPIFSSYIYGYPVHILSGCFSPTRPGVIYIGKSDGKIHVWDLTDQSHKEVQEISGSSDGITVLKFHKKQNILSIGDLKGSIVLLQLPQNLFKMSPNEKETMAVFWELEKRRTIYVRDRFEARQEESKEESTTQTKNEDDMNEEEKREMQELRNKLQQEYKKKYTDFMNEFFNEDGSEEEA